MQAFCCAPHELFIPNPYILLGVKVHGCYIKPEDLRLRAINVDLHSSIVHHFGKRQASLGAVEARVFKLNI